MQLEFQRNRERYQFLKWGQSAFRNFKVVPPGTGICHQVNLEYLARVVMKSEDGKTVYPDTLVGTDSHTTMINGLGVLGWGVGGIEAEAAMLGQPVSMLIPQVVGVKLTGALPEGATATDLVLTVTEMLRKKGVVGKFVEFFGDGLAQLPLADRATIANMAPEYGATCGIFPVDAETLRYLRFTGRSEAQVKLVEAYFKEQGLFHAPGAPEATYTDVLTLDLGSIVPSLAGPTRPQDRVKLTESKTGFHARAREAARQVAEAERARRQGHRDARRQGRRAAARLGRHRGHHELHEHLEPQRPRGRGPPREEGGREGPHAQAVGEDEPRAGLEGRDRVPREGGARRRTSRSSASRRSATAARPASATAARCPRPSRRPSTPGRSSPPRCSAATATSRGACTPRCAPTTSRRRRSSSRTRSPGRSTSIRTASRSARGSDGKPVFLKDIWPTRAEVQAAIDACIDRAMFEKVYGAVFDGDDEWKKLARARRATCYAWDTKSTYVKHPPYFDGMTREPGAIADIKRRARAAAPRRQHHDRPHLARPARSRRTAPRAQYLIEHGVEVKDFNSYGVAPRQRRGHGARHVRQRAPAQPARPGDRGRRHAAPARAATPMSVFDAAVRYAKEGVPLVVLAGKEYGSGSSRDWAAKGPKLLGVRAVIAESYERIHRSNLVGMGILPLEFAPGRDRGHASA